MVFNRDTEVRKLPYVDHYNLALQLEDGSTWKRVMGRVQRAPTETLPCPYKYTTKHIKMVEEAGGRQNRSCAEIFLEEWGCSGRRRPTLADLLNLLTDLELYKAADFVAVELLKEPRPRRPESGPAAEVFLSDSSEFRQSPAALLPQEVESLVPVVTPARIESNEISSAVESTRTYQQLETLPINVHYPRHIPYIELKAITNNFNSDPVGENSGRLLGKGAFGSVHLAIRENEFTAVKCLEKDNPDKMFHREVKTMFSVEHPNLLRLIGFSEDGPNKCLVYEYMSQGNLHERLSCRGRWQHPLLYPIRIKIALGTSKGLKHLHSFGLVHRDVKSENILLDKDLVPKLGDFGLARSAEMAFASDEILGTDVYMAPEVFRGEVPIESDVFSIGVVLLELITGLSPYISSDSDGLDLVTHVLGEQSIESLVDNKAGNWLSTNGTVLSDLLFSLARDCLEEEKSSRPTMSTVVERLEAMA
ncbi:interleukin-1 receptor-associated kinase 4-like [Thrips palmi]|uniref:Interleukin-1 receptor-associated kinase 4-like n=1 Tax=Thrips palmi TaxID=161013 RepID=A0A6P9AD68_THRPL|nr:interleukin-1 receptor-associated kinase 4-like [Thrips palmi]